LGLGISRFIIYDNSNKDTLTTTLKEYIEKKIVILINWQYPYKLKKSGVSGQITQQNHSIYSFQNSKYIGLLDIDEYVNIQNNVNIHTLFEGINDENIGSFKLLSKPFYNPNNLPTHDYNFLNIYTCGSIIKRGHEKHFVIPKNINLFSVHVITDGKKEYIVDCKKCYLNHYIFLNKKTRGIKKTNLIDKTIKNNITHLISV
jgi:hypothetical protein